MKTWINSPQKLLIIHNQHFFSLPAWLPKRPILGRNRNFIGSPCLVYTISLNIWHIHSMYIRGVGSGWAGWAHAHPDFGKIEGGGQWRRAALLLAYPDFQTLLHPCSNLAYVRQNKIQGRNMVFFKVHAYSISFCLTWSMIIVWGQYLIWKVNWVLNLKLFCIQMVSLSVFSVKRLLKHLCLPL